MCTVTILRQTAGLLLAMNRDERLGRAAEEPPTVHVGPGTSVRWVGPRDGEAGGTWIGASSQGVVACLLNGYSPGDPIWSGRGAPSRGAILVELLGRSRVSALEWLHSDFMPEGYSSFTMVVATSEETWAVTWRPGHELRWQEIGHGWSMLTSSAWRTAEVRAWREREFEVWLHSGAPREGGLPTFNLRHTRGREMWSPLMTRPFSATRSVTLVRSQWTSRRSTMTYWQRRAGRDIDPGAPDALLDLPLDVDPVAAGAG